VEQKLARCANLKSLAQLKRATISSLVNLEITFM
jgi:hypothetical protein